jgi:hypothetical protein
MNFLMPLITLYRHSRILCGFLALLPCVALAATLPQSGMVLHLDVASLSGLNDGDPLSAGWTDESGLGNDALAGAASTQPGYVADAGSGYPAVRFDGVDDYLEVAGLSSGPEASVFIVFAHRRASPPVGKRDTLVSTFSGSSGMHLYSSRYVASAPAPDYPSFGDRGASGTTVDTWANGWHKDEVTGDIFKDRFYVGSAVFSAVAAKSVLWIGARDNTSAGAGQNDIREVIVYDRALSTSERQGVQRYLGKKYDIELVWRPLGHPVEEYPHILASQQIGDQYSLGETGNRVADYANATYRQGNRVIKFRLSNKYDTVDGFDTEPAIDSLVELVRDQDQVKAVLDGPGTDYIFWMSSFAVPSWQSQLDATGLKPTAQTDIYNEVRALAEYLLITYSGTGKSFYLGNWEGDWMLAGAESLGYRDDPTLIPANRIQGMIDWATVRQQAIDDAKANVTHSNVDVWFYLEMNKADWMRDGLPCVANSVIPSLSKLDFISVSSYSIHKDNGVPRARNLVHADLDQIQGLIDAKPDPSIPGSRLMIGEYGYQYSSGAYADFYEFAEVHITTAKDYLSWPGGTLRFILQWQFFNQAETDGGVPKEMCQISNTNSLRPLYYLHENFYRAMRRWVDYVYTSTGALPSAADYEEQAVHVLDTVSLDSYVPFMKFVSYSQWRAFHFPDFGERADEAVSGWDSDPLNSGMVNLLRYACGLDRYQVAGPLVPHIRQQAGSPVYAMPYDPGKLDLHVAALAGEDLSSWPYEVFNSDTTSLVPENGMVEVAAAGLPNPGNPVFYRLSVSYLGLEVYQETFDPAPDSQTDFKVSLGGDAGVNTKEVQLGQWGKSANGSFAGGQLAPQTLGSTNARLAGVFLDLAALAGGSGNFVLRFDVIGDAGATTNDNCFVYVSAGSGWDSSNFLVLTLAEGGFSSGALEPLSATGGASAWQLASLNIPDTTFNQTGVEIPFTYDGSSTICIAFGAYNSGIAFDNVEIVAQP